MNKYWIDILLLTLTVLIWGAYLSIQEKTLQIVACDVGQGDSILIQYGELQTLIDGGPDDSVLRCLGKYMPYWDRTIELAVLTHPQSDHYAGFVPVFERYTVKTFLTGSVDSDTDGYRVLKKIVGSEGSTFIPAEGGERIQFGSIIFDVLNPITTMVPSAASKLGSFTTNRDLNDYSVVLRLTYHDFKGLFTGDIGPNQTKIMMEYFKIGDINYLKVPHHGSTNGLVNELLTESTPEIAVIPVGKKNKYGHPNIPVIEMLEHSNILVFRTDEIGDVEVYTNGFSYQKR